MPAAGDHRDPRRGRGRDRAAWSKRFNIPVDQWLKLLKQERNVTPEQYANDIIWPTLALRKLAGERLTVSREELVKEFETQYGEAVRVRLIAVQRPGEGRKLQAQAAAKPEDFGNLAKKYSEDSPRPAERRDPADPPARQLPRDRRGRVSTWPTARFRRSSTPADQYVILKRDGAGRGPKRHLRARPPRSWRRSSATARCGRWPRTSSTNCRTKPGSRIVWNDPRPAGSRCRAWPPRLNGTPITSVNWTRNASSRHGTDMLEGTISRRLLELACQAAERRA